MSGDMKSFRIDELAGLPGMAGGIGAPAAPAAAPVAPGKASEGKGDAGYPTFEAVLNDKKRFDALLAASEKTMAKLEEIAKSGASAQAKADARKALRGYDHMLDLLKKGLELTAKIAEERAAKAKARAKK